MRRLLEATPCLLLLSLLSSSASFAQLNTVTGTTTAVSDSRPEYSASGTFTTTDADSGGLDPGPTFEVVDPAPPPGGPFWTFEFRHANGDWTATRARAVSVLLEGYHMHGPHFAPQPETDLDPNAIPPVGAKALVILYGAANRVKMSKYRSCEHYLWVGEGTHQDHYGFRAVTTAFSNSRLQSDFEIAAKHTGSQGVAAEFEGFGVGSTAATGTAVSFDAPLGVLSFAIANVDVLDGHGGASRAVDPVFAGDPVLSGHFKVDPLTLQGQDPDGAYRFHGGELAIVDPSGRFDVSGKVGIYRIRHTAGGPPFTSFGSLDELDVSDVAEPSLGPSQFLGRFVDVDFLGQGLAPGQWLARGGPSLTFVTPVDLVTATNGFTQSVSLPATVLVAVTRSPSLAVPAIGTVGLASAFLVTAALAFDRLRLRRCRYSIR